MFLLAFVALVLSIVAFSRIRSTAASLERRIRDLEGDLTDLRRRVHQLQKKEAPTETPAPAPAPTPTPAPAPPPKPAAPPVVAQQPRPAPAPTPVEPPKPPIDWERWIGIRGAAVLGGIALALAGLLFFQYSIQHGLISKATRVTLGFAVGILCVGGSELVRRRGYRPAAEGLAGAGVVVLYAAIWAGCVRYQLIGVPLAFGLMAVVTAICGVIAVLREAPYVAVLGLLGGFATPLLLSVRHDRPIGLFGYVLLLDLGLIAVGRMRSWPWVGLLGLGGTLVLQIVWLGVHTSAENLLVSLLILTVFAALFAVAGFSRDVVYEPTWRVMQAGGLLTPFLFAIVFSSRIELAPHLWGIAVFAVILSAGAAWTGRRANVPFLESAAALGSTAILTVWLLRTHANGSLAWEASIVACALALTHHLFLEAKGKPKGPEGPVATATLSAGAPFVVLLFGSAVAQGARPWPWIAAWLFLAALLIRQARLTGLPQLQLVAAAAVAVDVSFQHVLHFGDPGFPGAATFMLAMLGIGLIAQVVPAGQGSALAAAILSLSLVASPMLGSAAMPIALGVPLLLGVLVLVAASRLGEGEWGLAAVLITAIVHTQWIVHRPTEFAQAGITLVVLLASVVLFVAWPFAASRVAATRFIWWAATVAGPLWFFPMKRTWNALLGRSAIGLLPLILGAVALAAVFGVRKTRSIPDDARRSATVGLSAVAICFASLAIALQLHKSWITVGWALEGAALVWLWRRLDHPGLKWFGLAHLGAAAFRLVPTAVLLESYPRSGTPIVNWLLYTYLVPAAAMFAAAWMLAPQEASRVRLFEAGLYAKGRPVGAIGASVAGIFTVFVWINLAIADWFADGPRLTLQFGRSPARDLTVSIAWAIYALILLGFGMARARIGLRWLSLGFLLVTIAKVFLYDLGELRDLYRVLSLVGLALSLLLVSVLYQRFVFRTRTGEPPSESPAASS